MAAPRETENDGEVGAQNSAPIHKLHGEARSKLDLSRKRNADGTTKRRHFKGFSQLIEEVDVDVFHSLDPVQFVPGGGADSFFQEDLLRWRELNTAADFNSLFSEVVRLVQSLPQLLFHKEKIVRALISRIRFDAILSLEPIGSLIGSLARDLQGDFLPYFPTFVNACANFIDSGGDREPEALQHVFTAMSLVFKHLLKFLVADLVPTLKVVKSLRYHRRDYVRSFTAEGIAFLLRNAPVKQLIKGVRRMFSDVFVDPSEERINGCAVTFVLAIHGAAGGFHSKAEGLIRLLLDPSILGGGKGEEKGDRSHVAMKVVEETLQMVCGEIKRDKIGILWDLLTDELQQLMADNKSDEDFSKSQKKTRLNEEEAELSKAEADGSTGKTEGDRRMPGWVPQAARLVHLVNIMLAYHRGSRVKDYGPLFRLGRDLLRPELFLLPDGQSQGTEEGNKWNLPAETLRLLLLLVQSHLKVAGASIGPTVIVQVAPSWALAFDCPIAKRLFDFIQGLLQCNTQVVHAFARSVLSALDRHIDVHPMRVLPLLVDVCQKLEPSPGLPPLLRSKTAAGCGNLVLYVRKVLTDWVQKESESRKESSSGVTGEKDEGDVQLGSPSASLVWHCLQCLPYLCLKVEEGESLAMDIAKHAQRRLDSGDVSGIPTSNIEIQEKFHVEGLLARALSVHTCLLRRHQPMALKSQVETYLQYAMKNSRSYLVLASVADFLDVIGADEETEGDADSSIIVKSRAQEVLDVLQPNLAHPGQSLRLASIRILCHLPPMDVTASEDVEQRLAKRVKNNHPDAGAKGDSKPCMLFSILRSIEGQPMLLDTYRQHAVSINHLKALATTGQLPPEYLPALTAAMIGVLHIPFSLIWDSASECLSILLDQHRNVAWPLFLEQLEDVQNEFIRRVFGQNGGQQAGRWSRIGNREPQRNDVEGDVDGGEKPESVEERFESSLMRDEAATNDATLLGLLLKCLLKVISVVEARSRQLMPVFFAFVGHEPSQLQSLSRGKNPGGKRARDEGTDSIEKEEKAAVVLAIGPLEGGGKPWRAALRDWLKLLSELKNAQSLYGAPLLKGIVTDRFLPDKDPAVQTLALRCLLNWKDGYLVPYAEHLEKLIFYRTMREELTTWSISKEQAFVLDEHRPGLIPLLMRVLLPKLKRQHGKITGRAFAGVHRGSVLTFLAQLEPDEVSHLICLVLRPMSPAFSHPNKQQDLAVEQPGGNGWKDIVSSKEGVSSGFIQWIDSELLASRVAQRRKIGVLYIMLDFLKCFGSSLIRRYLHALLAVVFMLLQESTQWNDDTVERREDEDYGEEDDEGEEDNEQGDKEDMADCAAKGKGKGERDAKSRKHATSSGTKEDFLVVDADDEEDDKKEGDDEDTGDQGGGKMDKGVSRDPQKSRVRPSKAARKDIRVLGLRVLGVVLEKYPDLDFNPLYWDLLFAATNRSIQCLKNESASSSLPSAFLSCLVAISSSRSLVHLLARDMDLIPNLLAVLSCQGAAPSVVSEVLKVVENVLDMEEEEDEEGMQCGGNDEKAIQTVLLPHLKSLLENLRELLSMRRVKPRGKKGTVHVKRELQILVRVSMYVDDDDSAEKLVEALLPFLRVRKRMDEEAVANVVEVIGQLKGCIPLPSVHRCTLAYGHLLVSISSRRARSSICSSIEALALVETNLSLPADLLSELNAMSSVELDELNYDKRLAAYARLVPKLFAEMNCQQARLILGQCIHDLYSVDMSLRHSAAQALVLFIRFAAGLPEEDDEDGREGQNPDINGGADNDDEDDDVVEKNEQSTDKHADQLQLEAGSGQVVEDKGGLRSLVHRVIWTLVKTGIRVEDIPVRREFVMLWREIADVFRSHPKSREFSGLLHEDMEADFFHNIVHLQVHRRIRAMAKFRTACAAGAFSMETLIQVFVPLFQHCLFDAKGPKEGNLTEGAITTLTCIASQLPWSAYFTLLMRMFRLIPLKPLSQKLLVRVMCRLLDEFHFFEGEEDSKADNISTPTKESKGSVEATIMTAGEGVMEEEDTATIEATEATGEGSKLQKAVAQEKEAGMAKCRVSQEVQSALLSQVYPALYKFLVSDMAIVNASVAVAIVKVLLLMPSSAIDVEMPRVLQGIANVLKSRLQSVRDEARSTLVAVVECLGPAYFHFMLDVLRSTLLRGYQLHVLGYTLHAVLVQLIPRIKVGDLDDCISGITEVLMGDIMGEVGEEKEVDAVAEKMKETRHMQSFESFRLIAQVTSFREHASDLLLPVQANLNRSLDPKIRKKIEMILHHMSIGLQLNPSMSSESLLVFVHEIVESGLQDEKDAAEAAAARKKARSLVDTIVTSRSTAADDTDAQRKPSPQIPNAHLIVEFSLQLMFAASKKEKFDIQDATILSMLDGMIDILAQCLSSRHDGVLSLAIKNLCFELCLPLPSVETHAGKIKSRVMDILAGMGRSTSLLAQACLKLLTVLIRRCKACHVSQEELRSLLSSPLFADLEENTTRNTIFSLLQAIVGRRITVPEVYDLMDRVAELMISTQATPVRELCGHTFLNFLLYYPLGKKRLEQHLQFIVHNLEYEHQHGREAALEMLHSILQKFPEPLVESSVDLFFVPLVTRLVNDDVSHCRAMAGTVLKELLGRVKTSTQERLLDFAFTWYTGDKTNLWRPAAQVIGIASESMGKNFCKYADNFLKLAKEMLKRTLGAMNSNLEAKAGDDGREGNGAEGGGGQVETTKDDQEEDPTCPYWREGYFTLTTLEKILQKLPQLILQRQMQGIWHLICELLLHRHQWVRKVSARLIGVYLAACEVPGKESMAKLADAKGDEMGLLLHPSWIFLLAARVCRQIGSDMVDELLGSQAVKNLVYLAAVLPLVPVVSVAEEDSRDAPLLKGCEEGEAKDRVDLAWRLLGMSRRQRMKEKPIRESNGLLAKDTVSKADNIPAGEESDRDSDVGDDLDEYVDEHVDKQPPSGKKGTHPTKSFLKLKDTDQIPDGEATVLLGAVFQLMSRIALHALPVQAAVVLRWFAAITTRVGQESIRPHLKKMLLPLFRISEGLAGRTVTDELKELAEEVLAHIRNVVGLADFVTVYNNVRQSVKVRRDKRKQVEAITKLVAPEVAARRKMKHGIKRQAHRKRKIDEQRRHRVGPRPVNKGQRK